MAIGALGMLLWAAGCAANGQSSAPAAHAASASDPNTYAGIVAHWEDMPVEQRRTVALEASRMLGPPFLTKEGYSAFQELLDAIVAARDYELVQFLDKAVEEFPDWRRRKHSIRWAFVDGPSTPRVRAMLKRMAKRYHDSVLLAPYRNGGIRFLVRVARDEHESQTRRREALNRLSVFAGSSVIPELQKLFDDRMPDSSFGPAFGPDTTIGDDAKEAVRSIRSRAAHRDDRK